MHVICELTLNKSIFIHSLFSNALLWLTQEVSISRWETEGIDLKSLSATANYSKATTFSKNLVKISGSLLFSITPSNTPPKKRLKISENGGDKLRGQST